MSNCKGLFFECYSRDAVMQTDKGNAFLKGFEFTFMAEKSCCPYTETICPDCYTNYQLLMQLEGIVYCNNYKEGGIYKLKNITDVDEETGWPQGPCEFEMVLQEG